MREMFRQRGKQTQTSEHQLLNVLRENLQSAKERATDLPALLRRFLAESRKTDYRDHFPWVDNIQKVKSPTVREEFVGIIRQSVLT